jgi:imidazolonepropionase-like amidohydrolase
MRARYTTMVLTAMACAALTPSARADDDTFVLQAAKVVTVSGDVLADGGSVYVSSGRVEDVKPGYVNPWGAEVREHKDDWLLPGMIEAHSQGGLERGNEQAPNTPFVSVLDGLDPLSTYFEELLRDGVTTVFVVPGDATLLGGQGLVLKPVGRTAEEMIVRRAAGLKIALAPRRGTSRMAQLAELRRTLDTARRAEGGRVVENPDETARDPRQEALVRLLAGDLPAVMACSAPVDVSNALRIMDEYGLSGFVTLGTGARRALPLLASSGLPCVMPPSLDPVETDPETGSETRRRLVSEFDAAGVPIVLQGDEASPYGQRSLWYQAAVAVSQGLSRAEALKAVTLQPARLLQVADRVGSIEKGKDANLVLWSGDPLDPISHVRHVYIEGEQVYDRATDRKLKRLLDGMTLGREEEE